MLAIYLRARGYTVVEAPNGNVAMDVLVTSAPDVLVTDLFMPEMDGFELIIAARRHRPGLKIIAMTGSPRSEAYLRTAQTMGATRTIKKPFKGEELVALVGELLAD